MPASRKTIIGLGFIALAALGWTSDIIIPFTSLPHKALLFTIALCIAEASFLIGLTILGKAYYHQLRDKVTKRWRK